MTPPPTSCSHQDQAGVHQSEGPRASDSSAAVHHRGPVLRTQRARLTNLEEEVEEGSRRFRDTKVRPRGVVKVVDLPWLAGLWEKMPAARTEFYQKCSNNPVSCPGRKCWRFIAALTTNSTTFQTHTCINCFHLKKYRISPDLKDVILFYLF